MQHDGYSRGRGHLQMGQLLLTVLAFAVVILVIVSRSQTAFSNDFVPTVSHRLIGHQACVFSLAISPDGNTLASGDANGTLILWDLTTFEEIAQITASGSAVRSLAFSVDGRTLALAGSAPQWKLYFLNTNKLLRSYSTHKLLRTFDTGNSVCMLHYRDMQLPAFTRSCSGEIQRWDPKTGLSAPVQMKHPAIGELSGDARLIVGWKPQTTGYPTVIVRGFPQGDLVQEFTRLQFHAPRSQFSHDASQVATGSFTPKDGHDPRIRLWSVRTGMLTGDLTHRMQHVNQIAFDRSGTLLCAVGGARDQRSGRARAAIPSERVSIEIWNLKSMKRYPTEFCEGNGAFFPRKTGRTYCCEFSPDSRLLATSGGGAEIILWKTSDK